MISGSGASSVETLSSILWQKLKLRPVSRVSLALIDSVLDSMNIEDRYKFLNVTKLLLNEQGALAFINCLKQYNFLDRFKQLPLSGKIKILITLAVKHGVTSDNPFFAELFQWEDERHALAPGTKKVKLV